MRKGGSTYRRWGRKRASRSLEIPPPAPASEGLNGFGHYVWFPINTRQHLIRICIVPEFFGCGIEVQALLSR